jgi:ABC-type dipeptide/oligopeptide/nickel transport system permease subunit
MSAEHAFPAPRRLGEAGGLSASPIERLRNLWSMLRRSKLALIGLVIITILVVLAIIGPAFAPYDPNDLDVRQRSLPPSITHPFGTDDRGRDVLSRVLHGARVSL